MKKSVLILVLVAAVLICGSANAAVEKATPQCSTAGRFYIGGGLQYDIANFREGDDWIVDDWELENTWGLQLKGGYFVLDYLAIEGLFQYHHNFK